MAKDLTVHLEDRPGTLADVGEALGKAGVNIGGGCGFSSEGKGVFHFLVEDAAAARKALEAAGMKVAAERDVLVTAVEDKPGALGAITRKIAAAGVNIDFLYLGAGTRLVLGVSDPAKAKAALG